ncbi:Alpha/Beta hydrolase protein [Fusarium venenatum]|uniref:Alpha/Beta hydrolase protein n=1 Tax=Fusarium venenatum TaxID=56646 RepID=UPI001D551232|nr:Alpha/Beta hydrolase protein [Fusarium venenatum]
MANVFSGHITRTILFAGYKLTCVSEGRFPTALQDAITVYLHILSWGISAKNVVLSGDSAGGHLVIFLLRYVEEYLPATPGPRAAMLWSPWIDIAGSASADHVLHRKNYHTDYLPADFAEWATESFAPQEIVDRSGPYITLKSQPFRTVTKLWVHVGDLELLYDEVTGWARDMRDAGNDITLIVEPDTPHDIVESGYFNGFRIEGEQAVQAAAEWLQKDSI